MKVLYFDLAKRTGWACGTPAGVEGWGAFEMPQTRELVAPYLEHANAQIAALHSRFCPSVIAFEAPILSRRDNPDKLRKLYGLANVVEVFAYRHKARCLEATIGNVRSHFLGKGYPRNSEAANRAMRVRCRELGWNVPQSDEANALAGLSYILSVTHPELATAVTPLFRKAS